MSDLLRNWEKKSAARQKDYRRFLEKAGKPAVRNAVLEQLPELHAEAFRRIDCLQCANCCKTYSPRFKPPDIKRISRHLQMKEREFIDRYLRIDDEGDYVVKSTPCPFLGADNRCGIYDVRPSDCERFPYTDEDVLVRRPALTQKNSTFCPIVYFVLEGLLVTLQP
jgi:Fe-S-cluster containining protein